LDKKAIYGRTLAINFNCFLGNKSEDDAVGMQLEGVCEEDVLKPRLSIKPTVLPLTRGTRTPRAGSYFLKPCDLHLQESLELAERMIALSFQGDQDREDNGCGIIYGMMRDAGFRLKHLVTREIESHRLKSSRSSGAADGGRPAT